MDHKLQVMSDNYQDTVGDPTPEAETQGFEVRVKAEQIRNAVVDFTSAAGREFTDRAKKSGLN